MWQTYEDYCAEMEYLKAVPLSEEIWRREYSPKDKTQREPLIITPKKSAIKGHLITEKDHISDVGKTIMPKKKKAPCLSRKGWTKEQIRARKAENVRNHRARKKSAQVIL